MEKFDFEFRMAKRESLDLSFVIFDLDKFRLINDTYGHKIGDDVLKAFSNVLRELSKNYSPVGRVGGEEFGVLLPQTSIDEACEFSQNVREKTEKLSVNGVNFSVSGGIASLKFDTPTNYEELYIIADKRLYRAKELGRNRIVCS